MHSTETQDTITIPRKLLTNFTEEFHKLQGMYEMIDHFLAEKDIKEGNTKSFNNVTDLFNDLDN